MPTTPAIDPNVRIGHVHPKVADIDRSLHFYCGVLGFLVVEHWGTMQHLSLQATTTPYRAQYLAEPRRNASTRWHNRAVSRRYPVPTRANLADALRRLTQAGIPLVGASPHIS